MVDRIACDHIFIESGRCLRHRHGILHIERLIVMHHEIMIAVSEFMRQCHQIRKRAGEVGQHTKFLFAVQRLTERAAHFAVSRIKIDPALREGALHHLRHIRREGGKYRDQVVPCLLCGITLCTLSKRRKQFIPRQSVCITEFFRF